MRKRESTIRMSSIVVLFIIVHISLNAQVSSVNDTINTPYWKEMMMDRTINFFKTKRAYDLYFSNKEKVKGTGFKIFERWANNAQYNINSDGSFISADHTINEVKRYRATRLSTRGSGGDWRPLGPFSNPGPASMRRMLGRINDIAFHPTNSSILYAGAASGGLWVSSNKGTSWTSSTDNLASFGVSAILVLPNTTGPTLLIGSGDRDANDAPGLGVYKSTDGGVTLTASNTGMGLKVINRLLLNPQNPNTILAATDGGIYISYNQGANWALKSSNNNFIDMEYCPDDTLTIYACSGGTFYKTNNAGTSWTTSSTGFSSTGRNRMAIAVTPANPKIVYIISSRSSNNGFESFYKSSDKGVSFVNKFTGTTINLLGWSVSGNDVNRGGQGFFDLAIEGSNTDSNVVHVGGIQVWRTTNGGSNFSCVSDWTGFLRPFVHADIHCLVRNPTSNELFVGSDGGVDYTANNGTSYTNVNEGLAISQFYNLGLSQLSTSRVITGAQDNGTSFKTGTNWTAALGGDGMQCEISNFDTSLMIGSLYYGQISRTTNGTLWNQITGSISETGPWVTPLQLHPRVKNVFITAFTNIWLSKNIDGASPSFTKVTTGLGGQGSAIRFSNNNDSFVFVGWDNGSLRYCDNIFASSPSFVAVTMPVPGSGPINDIETSYSSANTLYVTRGNKIYKSNNKGASWTDYSTGLPNLTMYCIAADKNRPEALYLGAASGVYFRDSTMTTWAPFYTGLSANAPIRDLEIVSDNLIPENSQLFAATYGRGLWVSPVRKDSIAQAQKLVLTATLSDSTPFCSGDSVTVNLTGADSFTLEPNEYLSKPTNKSFVLKPTVSTSYKVYGRNPDGKVGDTSFSVTVKPLPTLSISPKTKTIKKGDTLVMKATGASTFEWTPDDYITTSNGNNSSIVIRPDTLVKFDIKGTSSNGCVNYTKATITVSGNANPTSAIASTSFDHILVYPNPSKDILHIQSKEALKIELVDISGKLIATYKKSKEHLTIDVSTYTIGQYLLIMRNAEGNSKNIKFTIER